LKKKSYQKKVLRICLKKYIPTCIEKVGRYISSERDIFKFCSLSLRLTIFLNISQLTIGTTLKIVSFMSSCFICENFSVGQMTLFIRRGSFYLDSLWTNYWYKIETWFSYHSILCLGIYYWNVFYLYLLLCLFNWNDSIIIQFQCYRNK
jgi:hypothetical protein